MVGWKGDGVMFGRDLVHLGGPLLGCPGRTATVHAALVPLPMTTGIDPCRWLPSSLTGRAEHFRCFPEVLSVAAKDPAIFSQDCILPWGYGVLHSRFMTPSFIVTNAYHGSCLERGQVCPLDLILYVLSHGRRR